MNFYTLKIYIQNCINSNGDKMPKKGTKKVTFYAKVKKKKK